MNHAKGFSQDTNTSLLHKSKGSEMPVSMKVLRGAFSPLHFCQSVPSSKPTWNSRWFLEAAVKWLFSQTGFRTSLRSEAIDLPRNFGMNGRTLDLSNDAKTCENLTRRRNSLASLCTALIIVMSYAVAGAQTTTTLTAAPSSAPNGSVFTMTAKVKAGGTALGVGTVSFRDTYNGITQVLGTVQVQSGNNFTTNRNAVLKIELGGIGTHSIVATFNATKTNATSSSAAQSISLTGKYPTVASLVQTGGTTGNYSLTTTIVGVGSLNLLPTGTISLRDTSNSNYPLGSGTLINPLLGEQTVTASGSPIAVGNNPQDLVAGDFNNNGTIDLAVLNTNDATITILKGDGAGPMRPETLPSPWLQEISMVTANWTWP